MKPMDKIRKLLGVRSPSLESCGYYACGNCEHHVSALENDSCVYCRRHKIFVRRQDTCKRAKPIVIRPLKLKHGGRGLRANLCVIDEWSEFTSSERDSFLRIHDLKKEKKDDQT